MKTPTRSHLWLDAAIVLYLLSGAVGVWAAYDRAASASRFGWMALLIGLCYTPVLWADWTARRDGQSSPLRRASALAWFVSLGIAVVVLIGLFNRPAGLDPSISAFPWLAPNLAAGLVELALPLAAALLVAVLAAPHLGRARAVPAILVVSVLTLEVFWTGSRGAWLGIGIAGIFAATRYLVARTKVERRDLSLALGITTRSASPEALSSPRRPQKTWLVPGVVVVVLTLAFVGVNAISVKGSDFPRPILYDQVLHLLTAYGFTGVGPGMFPMVYSTYALLIDYYFLPHAHSLYLQVWIEQGLLGIASLLFLSAAFFRWAWVCRANLNTLAWGGVAATGAMLLHGLVDAPIWYAPVTPGLVFLPFCFAVAVAEEGRASTRPSAVPTVRTLRWAAVVLAVAIVLSALAVGSSALAAVYANLGAVEQTRIELGRYKLPEAPVEVTRRTADFGQAESLLQHALELDPGNETAHQRLAELDLARGEYARALIHARAAYARDTRNAVNWQLLGDAYLANGEMDQAAAFWEQVADAEVKLRAQAAVRYDEEGDPVRAEWVRAMADRIQESRARH